MEVKLRLDGESDDEFRRRAERTAVIARVLVRAALDNLSVQRMIADPLLPDTEESIRKNPPVRLEYEQAIAIGDIGSCLSSTRSKNWGDGPWVMPLERDDPVDSRRVLYLYRENSLYNRRYLQRQELKRLLGRDHRSLVTKAKRATKRQFLALLTELESHTVRRKFRVDPGEFWRAVHGRAFLKLPSPERQLEFDFNEAQ